MYFPLYISLYVIPFIYFPFMYYYTIPCAFSVLLFNGFILFLAHFSVLPRRPQRAKGSLAPAAAGIFRFLYSIHMIKETAHKKQLLTQ